MNDKKITAGADENTPSRSQYFSWINNTNEGSTEKHTLINLEYFKWLCDEYGMKLDIYAWDAGNLDGSCGTYQTLDSEKIKAQYPNGYAPIAKAAAKSGTRLGIWCGPDGFGNTPEEAKRRHELMVSLCRDCNFALFKIDAVCSGLREEKQDEFVSMMKECREYSPDLILLNHRLKLGRGMPYATTFLFNGTETYVDVHIANEITAPHHRAFIFSRGNVPELKRLTEDHGVCISSCIDFFDDDLIYQAFGRCLILAPEIYANPWLLRDDEQAKLARIYNLHRTYRGILTNGMLLPDSYGPNAVSRGNKQTRFIVTGNDSWESRTISINLNTEIGLEQCDACEEIVVSVHHPYEKVIGIFHYGDTVKAELRPFRAALIEVSSVQKAHPMLTGCEYEILHETDGIPDKVKILSVNNEIKKLQNGIVSNPPEKLSDLKYFDNTLGSPIRLDKRWERCDLPNNIEQIFETAQFAIDNDSLESRSLKRSGETEIPQVKAARDAFFNQKTYGIRGCESRFAFDGNDETFFDGVSKTFYEAVMRINGGCLRVDFGDVFEADTVMIEYFDIDNESYEVKKQTVTPSGHASTDLGDWREVHVSEEKTLYHYEQDVLVYQVHNIIKEPGIRKQVFYNISGKIRYLRIPNPLDRIFKIALVKDGAEIKLKNPKVLNLLPSYHNYKIHGMRETTVTVNSENWRDGSYLAIGIEGNHGFESVYAVAEIGGRLMGCPDRAPSYPSNAWECPSRRTDSGYTYFLPVTKDMLDKEIKIHIIECSESCRECDLNVHLCEPNDCRDGIISEF